MNFYNYIIAKKSLNRTLTDKQLKKIISNIKGKVIEIGASPTSPYKSWSASSEYLLTNYDLNYNSKSNFKYDLKIDARSIQLKSSSVENIVCVSVLEHIDEPEISVYEMLRVLKKKGKLIIAVPWIYPYHGAPSDFQRFSINWFDKFDKIAKIKKFPIGNKYISIAHLYQIWFLTSWPKSRFYPTVLIKFILCSFFGIFFYLFYILGSTIRNNPKDSMMNIFVLSKL